MVTPYMVCAASMVRLAWVMGYDLNPLLLIEEKSKYLGQAAKENAYLFFEHDPYCDLAKIKEMNGDFAVEQRYTLS